MLIKKEQPGKQFIDFCGRIDRQYFCRGKERRRHAFHLNLPREYVNRLVETAATEDSGSYDTSSRNMAVYA